MKRITIVAILLSGCQARPVNNPDTATNASQESAGRDWSLTRDATSAELMLGDGGVVPAIRIVCGLSDGRLTVNVPGFDPIGSEERLSFGVEGNVIALVADTERDPQRGGVSGRGPVPDELKALITAPIYASYGSQRTGPLAPPPDRLAGPFLTACSESLTVARQAAAKPTTSTHPCNVQDGQLLSHAMRALGTEPFWNARVEGRCVTYSTPENQAGTRIWTKVESGPMGPVWVGAYQGKPFVLRVQPAVGCSDGMSDRKYDWEAMLTVAGEERKGCAETK